MELQNRVLVVGQTLGEELERTTTTVATKPKNELVESISSLKATLEAMEAFKEKMRQDNIAAERAQEALNVEMATIETEKVKLVKEKVEAEEREKTLSAEVKRCHSFMLRITEECFQQGLRQTAFYHDVPTVDPRYDLDKDVVDGKLVQIGGNVHTTMEEAKGEENVVNSGPSRSHLSRKYLNLFK